MSNVSANDVPRSERPILADTGKLSAASALSHILNVVGGVVLAGILGPTLYGISKTVQLVQEFAGFLNVGSMSGVNRSCPALVSRRQLAEYGMRGNSSLWFSVLVLGLAGIAVAAAFPFFDTRNERTGVLALVAILFAHPFFTHGETFLSVEKQFGRRGIVILVMAAIKVTAGVAAAWFFGLAGFLSVFVLSLAWGGWYQIRYSTMKLAATISVPRLRRLVRTGFPISAMDLTERLLLSADRIVIVSVLGAEAMGLYQLALFALPVMMLVPFSLRQVVNTDVFDKVGQTNNLSLCEGVFAKSVTSIALTSPFLMGAAWFGVPMLIELLLPDYLPAIPVVKLFAVACFPILVMQTAFVIIIVACRVRTIGLFILCTALVCGLLSGTAASLGGGLIMVLAIHGGGWMLMSGGLLYAAQRLVGLNSQPSLARTGLWFLPMLYAAIELPLLQYGLTRSGLAPHSFIFAVAGGAAHTLACLPLFLLLESRIGGLSFFLRAARNRLSRRP